MAFPPWTIELIRRGLTDVARRASDGDRIEKLRAQASEILGELPETAARGIETVIKTAESGKKSVQRWARKHTALSIPLLNASGVLTSESGSGLPVAPAALELGHEMLAGDAVSGELLAGRLSRRLARVLPGGSSRSIAVASSFAGAISSLPFLLPDRQLVVPRHHAVRLPGGLPLPDACGLFAPVIQEVGSARAIDPHDFDALDRFCLVMADVESEPVKLPELNGRDAMCAVVMPVATINPTANAQLTSAAAMFDAGAEVVIMPGDGTFGGPRCGIIVGPAEPIERLRSSAAWGAVAAGDAVAAMVLATLEVAAANEEQIPVRALLNASTENLVSRAERIKTQFVAGESIENCEISEQPAKLTADGRWSFPSRQLRIKSNRRTAEEWQRSLLGGMPAVLSTVDDGHLILDLRWIPAADDSRLVEAVNA